MPTKSSLTTFFVARGLRGFGDGFAVIILPAYLAALDYSPAAIGAIATLALIGSAATTLAVGLLGRRYDLRNLLIAGGLLMAATGCLVAGSGHIAVIVFAVMVGTLTPSAGETGLMIPLEHASIAQSVEHRNRTSTFARYSLVGTLSTAAGALAAGLPDWLTAEGSALPDALRSMFILYALLGLAAAFLYFRLPSLRPVEAPAPTALGPSRGIVVKLAVLFSLDSFAGGFTVQSLLALWLFVQFDLSLASASLFFFCSSLLSASSFLFASTLARRIGLINTMVFTHIPSNLCIIAAAFAPNLTVALTLLLIRSTLSQMDIPVRTSYVMAVVTPAERPAAAGFVAAPRTLAASLSPALAGIMMASAFPAMPLLISGVLKIAYDIAVLYTFRHVKPPEEVP